MTKTTGQKKKGVGIPEFDRNLIPINKKLSIWSKLRRLPTKLKIRLNPINKRRRRNQIFREVRTTEDTRDSH